MTRANIHIKTTQGIFKFQCNGSAYPSNMMEEILKLILSTARVDDNDVISFDDNISGSYLSDFIDKHDLMLGSIGNMSYSYEIDLVKQTLRVWEVKTSWVNAPANWEAIGYGCYLGVNGRYGYTNWVKGKLLYNKPFQSLVITGVGRHLNLKANIIQEAIEI